MVGSGLYAQLVIHGLVCQCYELKPLKAVWGNAVQRAHHAHTTGAELVASLLDPCFKAKYLYKAVGHLQVKCME